MELENFIVNNNNINFNEHNCKVHEYDNCTLIKYNHGTSLNDKEDWVKYCRGAVVHENKVVNQPPLRFKDGKPENVEEYNIYEYIDGTMINVWNTNDKWYISTRSRIGALCRWQSKNTFRHMFLEIINNNNGNFDILDKTKSYTFVMVHKDNRIVQKYNQDKIVLVSVYNKETKEYEEPDNTYNVLKNDHDLWFETPELVENEVEFNESIQIRDNVGYIYIHKNDLTDRRKQLHQDYNNIKKLNGDSHVPLYNYIENRKNGRLPKYFKYYPENLRICNRYKHKIHDFTQLLYDTYGVIFKEKRISLKEAPFSMKPLLYEIHKHYLETKQAVGFSFVMNFINNLPTPRFVFVMLKFDKDLREYKESKQTNVEHFLENLDNDKLEEILGKLENNEKKENIESIESIINSTVDNIIDNIEPENIEQP